MLEIYEKLFKELENNKIDYCIYKGLNHLEEDLNGQRGDIDILIDKQSVSLFDKILYTCSFTKVLKNSFPFYYFAQDKTTNKFVMVDMDVKIRLGEKPYRPYCYVIDTNKLKKELKNEVWILSSQDYIPLMFFQRTTAPYPRQEDLLELQNLLQKSDFPSGYICKILENIIYTSWENIKNDILNAKEWKILQDKYKTTILQNIDVDYWLLFKQKMKYSISLLKRVTNKLLKLPSYKIRQKGFLVAFIGVDGAGKSSTVDYILNLDYFKYTGIKRIYFGNNEYWIPGVVWGLNNAKSKVTKILFSLLAHFDRSLRSLYAWYYIQKGYIVIADRFYYDNFIGEEMTKKSRKPATSILKKIFRFIFKPRLWIQPDLTIFLDVSPDVAYKRKQDYSYEMMLEVNKAYKEYMPKVKNVVIVNADAKQECIYTEVISHMLKLDRK